MKLEDAAVEARLRAGGTLLMDTSELWGSRSFLDLADKVNRWAMGRSPQVRIVVSAFAHTEHLAQERRLWRDAFDLQLSLGTLKSKKVDVVAFTPEHGERVAAWLAEIAPDKDDWRQRKWARVSKELGLPGHTAQLRQVAEQCRLADPARSTRLETMADALSNPTRRTSATLDWFIAGHAVALDALLVTGDKGDEFAQVAWATADQLKRTLDRLLAGP